MTPRTRIFRKTFDQETRFGFTLVELMIVIALLLILSTLTLAIFNSTNEGDRIRSSARQLQSGLLGARDRAIKAKAPRGLRLMIDTTVDPLTGAPYGIINSMVYLGAPDTWRQGTIQVGRRDFSPADRSADTPDSGVTVVRGWGTDWQLLFQQGLLTNGARMKIPADATGSWYTVDTQFLAAPPAAATGDTSPPDDILLLTGTGFRTTAIYPMPTVGAFDPLTPNEFGQANYLLELQPAILPGQEPLKLSSGIVVDVPRSQLPTLTGTNLDIMFSPRGLVASGAVLSSGLVHFYLCTQEDAELNLLGLADTGVAASLNNVALNGPRNAADPQAGEKLILTLFPQTGNIATFPVDITDSVVNATGAAGADTLADDPFRYAKIGGTAGR